MSRTILVPLDGSLFAEQVLPHAVALAEAASDALDLVLVKEPVPFWALLPQPQSPRQQAEEVAQAYLDGVVADLTLRTSVPIRTTVLDPLDAPALATYAVSQGLSAELLNRPVAAALAQYADRVQPRYVVLASHGRGPVNRAWLGSIADHLLRQLTCPVLVLRPQADRPPQWPAPAMRAITVAVDRSELAHAALQAAEDLARATGGRLRVLHTVEHALPFATISAAVPAGETAAGVAAAWRDEAQAYVDGLAVEARTRGVEAEGAASVGLSAPAMVLDDVARTGADLLVVSTHGEGGLRRFLLGSVADRLIRGATVPVLVVRPPR